MQVLILNFPSSTIVFTTIIGHGMRKKSRCSSSRRVSGTKAGLNEEIAVVMQFENLCRRKGSSDIKWIRRYVNLERVQERLPSAMELSQRAKRRALFADCEIRWTFISPHGNVLVRRFFCPLSPRWGNGLTEWKGGRWRKRVIKMGGSIPQLLFFEEKHLKRL